MTLTIPTFTPITASIKQTIVVKDVIVGFTNAPDPQLLSKYNATILEVYRVIPAIHAMMSQSAIDQLEQNPNIAYIAENSQTKAAGTTDWPLELIKVTPTVWTESTGVGVKIAILDTGINPFNDLKIQGGYNFVDNNTDTTGILRHGTMIASIIAIQPNSAHAFRGVAPDAQLYSVKVLNDQGEGTLDQAISGVQWAVENNMQIISISWTINDRNNALKQALDVAYNKGILIVAAAGNDGNVMYGVGCPAIYDSVIAVTAIKENTRKLEQACTGPEIELSAPGENIEVLGSDNKIYICTGTSYAVPYVTGTAALIWAKNSTLTNTEVRNILCQTATDLQPNDGQDRDIFFGYGLINAAAAIQAATNDKNPPTNPPTNDNNNRQQTNPPTPTKTNPTPTNKDNNVNNDNQQTNPPTPTKTNPTPTPPTSTLNITNIIITVAIISIIISTIIIIISIMHYSKNKKIRVI